MRKMRKSLSLLLALLMVISIMPIGTAGLLKLPAVKAEAAETAPTPSSGNTTGDAKSTYTWAFDASDGTLTISGTGVVNVELGEGLVPGNDETVSMLPWGSHVKDIKHVAVEEGITGLGDGSLSHLINMESVSLPSTLVTVGKYVFMYDISLKELIIPEGVTSVGAYSLCYLISLETLVLPDSLQTFEDEGKMNAVCLKNLTIPAGVESFNIYNGAYVENINNKSMLCVPDYIHMDASREYLTEEYRYYWWLYCDSEIRFELEDEFFGGALFSYSDVYLDVLTRYNARFGTSFSDSEDLFNILHNFPYLLTPLSLDRTIYCYENSAQHYVCTERYDRHILYGTDTEHTSCLVLSGTSTDDNSNTFTWSVDPTSRTLTVNGTEQMEFDRHSNLPGWYYCSEFYDTVNIGEGITSLAGKYTFPSFENLNLPATFSDIANFSQEFTYFTEVKNVNVSPENKTILSIDGVVYYKYSEEDLSLLKNIHNVDGTGDLSLLFYPNGRSYFSISERALSVQLMGFYNYLNEITIPDTVGVLAFFVMSKSLKKVNIPSSVKAIDGYWFYNYSLEEINVAPDNTVYASKDGMLYSKDLSTFYVYPPAKDLTELELPETVTEINSFAMYDSYGFLSLKDVRILNKDCEFGSNSIANKITIYGKPDSTAQTYASNYGNKFIPIEEKEIESIAVKTMPDKTEYKQGKQLKTDGLAITVNFADGTTGDRTTGFTVSGFDSSNLGTCTLTVSYYGATCTFDVTIIENTEYILTVDEKLSVAVEADDIEYVKFVPTKTATYKFTYNSTSQSYGAAILDSNKSVYGYPSELLLFTAGDTYYFELHTNYNCTFNVSVNEIEPCEQHIYRSNSYESTCYEKGYIYYECKNCNDYYYEDLELAPHTEGALVTVIAPTCTEEGYTIRLCSECGNGYKTDITEPIGHDFSTEWTVDTNATCTTDGSKSHHCSRCSEKQDVTVISSTGHKMTQWTTTKAPTCTEDGIRTRTCTEGDKTETVVIAATGHADENKDDICDKCGKDLGTKDPSENCSHMCHKTKGIAKFFWKIFNFFNKLFKIRQDCECGAKHW